ncbi:MAG: hypothetical protein HKN26_14545, partial [Acidimicrobiales bacterium]|nr:hypothetical protein [Acidimicrobiales bacterium]
MADAGGEERVFGDVGTSLLVDNDAIRVWELELAPGERSDLHHHQHDYVMVQIEGDLISAHFEPDSGGTFAGADQLEGPVAPGTVIFAEAGGIETAVNNGTETFREIVVEVKAPPLQSRAMRAVQHVSLNVADIETAVPFYRDVLGLEPLPRPDFGVPGAWFATGNGVQIHLIEDPDFVAPTGPHLAFETADIDQETA